MTGTRGTSRTIKKNEQITTSNVRIQTCGSLGNKQEELKLLVLLLQHCWNNRYGGELACGGSTVMDGYKLLRKNKQGKREDWGRSLHEGAAGTFVMNGCKSDKHVAVYYRPTIRVTRTVKH